MYIEPKTNIRLLKDAPLDATYDHTIFFSSANAQSSYFIGLQKYNLTNYTYQRVRKGVARVGIKADNLYDCNYMMFQNTNYGSKWFYAFITSIEFVNNECSEVYFELDVMQTWFFDYTLDLCFVEREHSVTDIVGEHIEPENVDTGEAVFNTYGVVNDKLTPFVVMIMVSDTTEAPDGNIYGGVYGGATLYAFMLTDTSGIKDFLNKYVQKPEAIIGMYMCPQSAIDGLIPTGGAKISQTNTAIILNSDLSKLTGDETLNGYKPKNKKLYTYPYNYLLVNTGSANALTLRYEFFDDLTPKFSISLGMTMPVQCLLTPRGYKGISGQNDSETLTLKDYPMCSWATDAFKAWLAQNAVPITTNALSNAVQGAISGGAIGVGTSVISSVTNILTNAYKASIQADPVKGSVNNGVINVARGRQDFYCGRMSVTKEYAMMIDDYFTMFGYATRRCKRPNRNSRPHWNYVKTIGCTITGSVPSDDMKKICSIYNNGITFWKNGNEIGDYTLDNSPTE